MPFWLSIATAIRGWAIAEEGEVEAGIEEIRQGMADFATTGTSFLRPYLLGLLAEQYGRSGNLERGHTLIAEALAASDRMGGRWCDPELHRRNGDLHATAGDDAAAEAAYRQAVDLARYQGARALELRSATRLAASWQRHDRADEIAPLLRADRRGPRRHDGPARPRPGPLDPAVADRDNGSLTAPIARVRIRQHRDPVPSRTEDDMRIDHRASEGATLPAAIEHLRATLSGQLVTPGDAGYDAARRVHNGMIDRYPLAIARCRDVADVIAVDRARPRREAAASRSGAAATTPRASAPSTTASSSTCRR